MSFLSLVTLTFDLQTRPSEGPTDQACLPCEFGANPFRVSRDILCTNKNPQTDGARNRTFHSSLRAVTNCVAQKKQSSVLKTALLGIDTNSRHKTVDFRLVGGVN